MHKGYNYKLKPCPFCGGKAYLERRHRAFINAETSRVAFVRCTECEARSGRFELAEDGTPNHSQQAEIKAVISWNRRSGTTEGEEEHE